MGINGLVNAFQREDKFGGDYQEYLERSKLRFQKLKKMCEVLDPAKLREIPVMLNGDALDLFDELQASCATDEEVFRLLRTWYLSYEKYARILYESQTLRIAT